jgi:5'(3')-deoxyribonucleotidase
MTIFAVDVDDVCADLMTVWLNEYNWDFEDNLKREDMTDWNISLFVKKECGNKILRYIEDPTMYDFIQPLPDSLEGVNILRKIGRVVFVTSATNGCAGRKFRWLQEKEFNPAIEDYIEAKDKSLIKYDIMIDDNFNNIKDGKNNILFNQPWNKKYTYPHRMSNWKQMIDYVKANPL